MDGTRWVGMIPADALPAFAGRASAGMILTLHARAITGIVYREGYRPAYTYASIYCTTKCLPHYAYNYDKIQRGLQLPQ